MEDVKLHVNRNLPVECSDDSEYVGQEKISNPNEISAYIELLKNQVALKGINYIKGRRKENRQETANITSRLYKSSSGRRDSSLNLLYQKLIDAQMHIAVTKPIKLAKEKKSPTSITCVYSDRNQRIMEDQSVGRKQIYYDQCGDEALVASDNLGEEDEKKASENYILRTTIDRFGSADAVLDVLAKCFYVELSEVKARCEDLLKRENAVLNSEIGFAEAVSSSSLDLDLNASLDLINKHFCRRCLEFRCGLHGSLKDVIFPAKKQPPMSLTDELQEPCGSQCYLLVSSETKSKQLADYTCWKPFEKSLFEKGVEIFGKNSCLITRNLLKNLKTCSEVFQFMTYTKPALRAGSSLDLWAESSMEKGTQLGENSRSLRRRVSVRRLKFTWNSSGYRSVRRRVSVKKGELNRHYDPCGCRSGCGKDCLCHLNKTFCEKYCGCPRSCKNRFRGCRCAKNQCQTRQCSCVAANRECDPDVCRNCWISCGDGTSGAPQPKGANYNCRNMEVLIKQHQKLLVRKSDVSGFGVFLKNTCKKDQFIGEYIGELITHDEAEKRGITYDRINSSYLFDLNDQYVIDAQWVGNKLRFANHSSKPNCYAKILMVGGDHRIGIFAKRRISAGEELFYDYHYKIEVAPAWARNNEASKKDDCAPSN